MRFGSVCSGIDAASIAWTSKYGPMNWTCEFFSEIDKFPSAVLAHHYGSNMPGEEYSKNAIPNYGDMTKFQEWPDHDRHSDKPIDVLIGGTPCQSFSIAGLRDGLNDPRGNLMLTYLAILKRYQPEYFVWENVPGVLSSNGGRDFGTFLGGLAELGYGFAYRVLDAQFIRVDGVERAVPQRRRRVFVVGCLGDWRVAAAILFEQESLCRNTAPSRKTRKDIAADARQGFTAGSFGQYVDGCGTLRNNGGDNGGGSETIVAAPVASTGDVSHCLNAGGMGRQDYETETLVTNAIAFAQNTRDEVRLINGDGAISGALAAEPGMKQTSYVAEPITIMERGRKDGPNLEHRQDGTANTLLTPNGGCGGMGVGAIAFKERGGCEGGGKGYLGSPEKAFTRSTSHDQSIFANYAVRRLTPVECARLQAFPDNFTQIPWRNKPADKCPDGPQYKAYGNSMATNVIRWIGQRIELIDNIRNSGTSPQ